MSIGILLHTSQYVFNRSLWVDEAGVALDILEKPYMQLLPSFSSQEPLNYSQITPAGFLVTTKFVTQLFGESEYILRLIPFLSAILSLFLFIKVAEYALPSAAIPFALGLYVFSDRLVYHSSALKPYSSDICIALLLYVVSIPLLVAERVTWHRSIGFGMLGAVVLWFSYPAIFVLAGIGVCLLFSCYDKKAWQKLNMFSIAFTLWFVSFGLLFYFSFRITPDDAYLQQFWAKEFMPLPPASGADMLWYVSTFFSTIQYMLNIPYALPNYLTILWKISASTLGLLPSQGLSLFELTVYTVSSMAWCIFYVAAGLMFLPGCVSLGSKSRKVFFLLSSPILFTLLASGLHKYPFGNRLILFLFPMFLMLSGAGAGWWIHKKSRKSVSLVGMLLIGIVFLYPVSSSVQGFLHPRKHEEARPVLQYLKDHKQGGDSIYVYYASGGVYRYYSRLLGFENEEYIQGIESRKNWQRYIHDLQQIRGKKRVWLFFSHAYSEEAFFLAYLDRIGTRLDEYKDVRASVYLYEFR